MVRMMKCPYCGKDVRVSSHWTTATCQNCHESFEIGVEVFELSEEEQAKEQERAMKEIHEKEQEKQDRQIETKRRLRQMLHLPEPDPYAGIKFEGEEEEKPVKNDNMGNKKRLLIAGVIGAGVLVIIVLAVIIVSALGSNSVQPIAEATPAPEQTEATQVASSGEATVEQYDGTWTDGFSIDSNPDDGKYMIDLQSSDTGEQKEVYLKPDVEDDSVKDSVSQNNVKSPEEKQELPDNTQVSGELPASPAAAKDEGNAYMGSGNDTGSDKALINKLFNGQ